MIYKLDWFHDEILLDKLRLGKDKCHEGEVPREPVAWDEIAREAMAALALPQKSLIWSKSILLLLRVIRGEYHEGCGV
jgi:hypothetical protein